MASCTKVFEARCRLKQKNQGRARKNKLANHGTTPTMAAFFGDAPDAPAQAARKPQAQQPRA